MGSMRCESDDDYGDAESCDKLDFLDKTSIERYTQQLNKKICSLQSSVKQTETNIKNLSPETESKCCRRQLACNECPSQKVKKKPNPNKLRYDEASLESSTCTKNNFACTLKATDWEAEYEKMMHKDMPPLDLKALGFPSWPGGCGPPTESLECPQPKCQKKLPPLRKRESLKVNNNDMTKLIADCNTMKKREEAPPLPAKWRTAPSYSFLYEDVPLELTLLQKKSFDCD